MSTQMPPITTKPIDTSQRSVTAPARIAAGECTPMSRKVALTTLPWYRLGVISKRVLLFAVRNTVCEAPDRATGDFAV